MMKTVFYTAVLLLMVIVTGCTELRLANGIYLCETAGRDDMATVYNDQIFLRLRNAEDDTMNNGYWDWAGKYSIGDGNKILLDMNRKDMRNWKFYYDLTMQGRNIIVEDFRSSKQFRLELRPAMIQRNQNNQNPGNYPVYR